MRAHKFSLVWFGHSIKSLSTLRSGYLGAEIAPDKNAVDLPRSVLATCHRLLEVDRQKGGALQRYFSEMSQGLHEMHRVLRPNRAALIVVASSILKGIDVQTHTCLGKIAVQAGFELAGIGRRLIHRDKRMMPTSSQSLKIGIESRMHEEFVIGLWKAHK